MDEILIFDNRTFLSYFWSAFKKKNEIYGIFFSISKKKSRITSIILYLLGVNFDFFLNAFFYSDNLITKRNNVDLKNSVSTNTLSYVINNELTKLVLSSVVSVILVMILEALTEIPSSYIRKYNEDLLSQDPLFIKSSVLWMRSNMLPNKIIGCVIALSAFLVSWYYMMAFSAVYPSSSGAWISGSIISFIINEIISLGIIIFHTLVRTLAKYNTTNFTRKTYELTLKFLG